MGLGGVKLKAQRVIRRIWVLIASTRALERPCSIAAMIRGAVAAASPGVDIGGRAFRPIEAATKSRGRGSSRSNGVIRHHQGVGSAFNPRIARPPTPVLQPAAGGARGAVRRHAHADDSAEAEVRGRAGRNLAVVAKVERCL